MPSDVLEMPATVEEALREVSRIKTVVAEAVEDGVKTALKAVEAGTLCRAKDMLGEARHTSEAAAVPGCTGGVCRRRV